MMLSTVNASQSRSTVGTSPWQRQGINHHWGLSRNQGETCSPFTKNRLPSYVESIMRVEERTIGSFSGQPPYIARFSIHLPVGLTISHPSLHLSPCLLAFLLFYHGISSFLEDIFSDASSGHVTRKKKGFKSPLVCTHSALKREGTKIMDDLPQFRTADDRFFKAHLCN